MSLKIICDSRESFSNSIDTYNDHFSMRSINGIVNMINSFGYDCSYFGGINELMRLCVAKKVDTSDYYINISDGLTQKNKRLQAPVLLELLGAKYSGSEPFPIALANNKYISKKIVKEDNSIKVAKDLLLISDLIDNKSLMQLNYPVVIKPNGEGSSIGITKNSLATNYNHAIQHIQVLQQDFDEILIEEYIPGYEITSLIIGNNENEHIFPLMITLEQNVFFTNTIMSSEIKKSRVRSYCKPNQYLNDDCINRIVKATKSIKKLIGLRDIARVDYRINNFGEIYFIEVNSNPVLSQSSEIGAIEELYNISSTQIIKLYVDSFISRVQN